MSKPEFIPVEIRITESERAALESIAVETTAAGFVGFEGMASRLVLEGSKGASLAVRLLLCAWESVQLPGEDVH